MKSNKDIIRLSETKIDLLLINILSIALIILTIYFPTNILRSILAFPFVMFFPGYTLLKICYSAKEIDALERSALSVGLSMIIMPLLGFILVYSPLKLTLYPSIFFIYIFILTTSIIGWFCPKFSFKVRAKLQLTELINTILALALITVIGVFIRSYPVINYSIYCGNWIPGNCLYPIYYTLQTGELLKKGTVNTPTLFSETIYNSLHNKANIVFQSLYFLISGFTELNIFLWLNKFFPIHGAFLFPLSVLLVANRIIKIRKRENKIWFYIFVYFVAAFASYRLIMDSRYMTDNLIIGLSMIFFAIFFLLNERKYKNSIFGITFGVFVFLYYYTAGLVFLIILICALLIQTIREKNIIPNSYILFYGVSFVSYYMYLASSIFHTYVFALEKVLTHPGRNPAIVHFGTGRMTDIGNVFVLSAYLNMLLLGTFITMFIYGWLKGKFEQNVFSDFVVCSSLGLVLTGILFFLWKGLEGAVRLNQYIVISYLLGLPLAMIESKKARKIAVIFSLLIVITSVVAWISGNATQLGYLTNSEKSAVEWYSNYGVRDKFVFTDFRIGPSAIMLNCFTFTGFSGHETELEKYLTDVYYGNSAINAFETLNRYGATYLLVSQEMINYGIETSPNNYKPMPQNSIIKYETSTYFEKIYDNGGAWYYKIREN